MPQARQYRRSKNFSENSATATDHTAINTELDRIAMSITELRDNQSKVQADDGRIKPGSITLDSLADDVRALLPQAALPAVSGADPLPVPADTPVTPSPTPNQPYGSIIHYHGDSTVYGAISGQDGAGQVAKPPPVWMQEILSGSPVYTVSNLAKSGSTMYKLLTGLSPHVESWATVMASRSNASVIILNQCINDTYEGRTVEQYKADVTTIITLAREQGKFVILETPNETDDETVDLRRIAMKEVAALMNVPVIDQYDYLKLYRQNNGLTIYQMAPDGYHPSDATYELKGKYAASRFLQIAAGQSATPSTVAPAPATSAQPTPFGRPAAEFGALTFRDEFDGSTLNLSAWNEAIWYEASHPTKNFAVRNGSLHIWPEAPFVNRTIDTDGKFYQTYGYFEMDAKLPIGKGCWPAFWLYAHPGDDRPEFDIMEAYPGGGVAGGWGTADLRPNQYAVTTHKANGNYSYHEVPFAVKMRDFEPWATTPIDLSLGFHKYALKWTQTEAQYYFDGDPIGPAMPVDDYFRNKFMYVLLDLWFGSASGQPDSTTPTGITNSFEIKYVRCWALADGTTRVNTNLPAPV